MKTKNFLVTAELPEGADERKATETICSRSLDALRGKFGLSVNVAVTPLSDDHVTVHVDELMNLKRKCDGLEARLKKVS